MERYWDQPEVTAVGRLAMHSTLTRADAPQSLDGKWRFTLIDRPEQAPNGFHEPAFDDANWDEVAVPGCWTMQGYDRPVYTNIDMPFRGAPPYVPDRNPTGLYRTSFRVPRRWKGRRIVLQVGAAESVLYVWVNGAQVGVSKDSRLAAEFDVTAHVRAGENVLAAMVVRWSDASYVEDQDQWWHAGIHRSVTVYATPRTHLADVHAHAGLGDDLTTGVLDVRAHVDFADSDRAEGWHVVVACEDDRGRDVIPLLRAAVPHSRARISSVGTSGASAPRYYACEGGRPSNPRCTA